MNEPLFITTGEDPDDMPNESDVDGNDQIDSSANNFNNNFAEDSSNISFRPPKHVHTYRKNNSVYSQNEYDPQYNFNYSDSTNNYNRELPNNNQNFPPGHRHNYGPHKHSHNHHNHHHHHHHNLRPNYNYNQPKISDPSGYENYPNSNEFQDRSNENFFNQRRPIQPAPIVQPMIQPLQTIQPMQPIQAIQPMPIMMPIPISTMTPVHSLPQVSQMPIVYQPLQMPTPISVQSTPLPTVSSQLAPAQPVIIQPKVSNQKLPAIKNTRTNRRPQESFRSLMFDPPPPSIPVKESPRFVYNIHHYPPATKPTKPKVIETNYKIIKKKTKKN
jgi:hypothetical protein